LTVTGLHHVSVAVADLERSLGFYRDLLGIPVREQVEMSGAAVAEIVGEGPRRMRIADLDPGDGRVIELVQDLDRPAPPAGGGHVALAVDDVRAVHARLVAAGVPARSQPVVLGRDAGRHWEGCVVAWTTDPDGTTVELVQAAR
jgi:glyoxylase I family protein